MLDRQWDILVHVTLSFFFFFSGVPAGYGHTKRVEKPSFHSLKLCGSLFTAPASSHYCTSEIGF